MKRITRSAINDAVMFNRQIDFLNTLSKRERDIFSIALTFNSALATNNQIKVGFKVSPYYEDQLNKFKVASKKYGFKWIEDIEASELDKAKDDLFKTGEYYELSDGNGNWIE